MAESQIIEGRATYDQWSKEESDMLLEIMVDAINEGLRNNGGFFTKQIVLDKILPSLNSKLGCDKNYKNYQSRLKWFKNRWFSYSTLMNFNPDFGYDSTLKRFTAPDKVWDDYLEAHPKNVNLRNEIAGDYEDLKIVIGGRVFEKTTKKVLRKRGRLEYEENSDPCENAPKSDIAVQLSKLTAMVERVYEILEKWEHERKYTVWDAIKEVPDFTEDDRLEALNLLDTKMKNDVFLQMTPEERANWINQMRKS